MLDFGCGAGEEAVYLAKMGARVTAIDISPTGIALTRARAEATGVADAVEARLMRCDPTELADASFDVVHGFGILHDVGLQVGLAEVHRLLKRGGRGVFWEHMGNSAFLARLRLRFDWAGRSLVKRVDHTLLSLVPALRLFASGVVIVVRK